MHGPWGRLGAAALLVAITASGAAGSAAQASVTRVGTTVAAAAAPAAQLAVDQTTVPSAVPGITPDVTGGATLAIAKVGNKVVVGGSFTGVTDSTGASTDYVQPYIFAFDATTGLVDPAFRPVLSGPVNALLPGPDGASVYIGGNYTYASTTAKNLVRLNLATGRGYPGFRTPVLNGVVNDLQISGSRLFVAGTFTKAAATAHAGLAAVSAATGAVDHAYLKIALAGHHNYPRGATKAPVGAVSLAITPNGAKMVAIGNFKTADGKARDQIVMVNLGSTAAVVDPNWRTTRYEPACSYRAFDFYVRDVDFSPDGSYFVVAATGAGYAGTLCDGAARFNTADVGQSVQPFWIAATGCDTLLSVEITTAAVYVGGHSKWMNAPNTGCSANAQQAQVARPGLAALQPGSGLPMTWNPGRHPRGHGAGVVLATADGLYVGSDTDYVGNRKYRRAKIAYFPLAGGYAPTTQAAGVLPGRLVQLNGSAGASAMTARTFTGSTATAPTTATVPGGTSFVSTVGGFMIGNRFVYGNTVTKALYYRTFDGTRFGAEVLIDPYNDPLWSTISVEGGTLTYRGKLPDFYSQLATVTGLTFVKDRIYYTLANNPGLYWRWFSPDSLIVGAAQFQVAGAPDMKYTKGMFYAAGGLYRGMTTQPYLYRLAFAGLAPSGGFTQLTGSGLATGGPFGAGALFLAPPANPAPVASFTSSCAGLTCSVDGTASTDAGGSVQTWQWTFGDGSTATGPTVSHLYATAASYPVTLTVTDNQGSPNSVARTVRTRVAPNAVFSLGCTQLACTVDGSASSDPEGTALAWAWDFGDGSASAGATAAHSYAAPGTYAATLRVTDGDGQTATTGRSLTVASESISFRGASSVNDNVQVLSTTVPASVQSGDLLLVALTTGTGIAGMPEGIPGLTLTGSTTVPSAMTTTVWQAVAADGAAGSTVSMTLSDTGSLSGSLSVIAYGGTSTTSPVRSYTGTFDSLSRTDHLSPDTTVQDRDVVVSLWGDKGATTTAWTAPAGSVVRDTIVGVGPGHYSTLVTDRGAPEVAGTWTGLTADTDAASRGAAATIVLTAR